MKKKIICGLLACAIFVSVAALPMVAYAADTGSDPAATPSTIANDGLWHISDDLKKMLKDLEGYHLTCYDDYKQFSVGYGSKCPGSEESHLNGQTHTITDAEAEQLLHNELSGVEATINKFIKDNNIQHITQNKYDALVSITYNIGSKWTTETNGNLRNAVLSGDNGSIFAYSLILWSKAGGEYMLMNRRMREALMYIRGGANTLDAAKQYFRYVFMNGNGGEVKYAIHGFYTEDPIAIRTQIEKAPSGPDETGAIVTYVFDGWYTASTGGTKVETLTGALTTGSVLYAHWKTPSGTPVNAAETGVALDVTVVRNGINVRTGPNTYYASVGKVNSGDVLKITDVQVAGNRTWGRYGDNWICLINNDGTEYTNYTSFFPMAVTVKANGVSVRDGASYNSAIVAQKSRGDRVSIKSLKSDGLRMWGKIDGGYIAMSDVVLGELPQEKATVTFKLDDGTVLSAKEYVIGSEVAIPQVTAKPGDGDDVYVFTGWDKEVTTCTGEAVYTATFSLEKRVGDINKDGYLNDRDAVYLLRHVLLPGKYPFEGTKDMNGDGSVNDRDAVHLLRHVLLPEKYPLHY